MYRKYFIAFGVIILLLVGYFIANNILFNGVRSRVVNENGFQANYFVKDVTKNKASVVLIGGGQWGDYWAKEFANKEMVGLSLPYTRKEGLPKLPEEINLEYFENAIKWLGNQKEVDSNKIVIMGASRNAELALIIASTFPEIVSGVVAYAPSSVSWSNTVLPYNSNELKPSWKYKGIDIPYIPMNKISGNNSDKIKMIEYWKKGLTKTDLVNKALIKVEKINGPILLFSGNDDAVWPSSIMADMIEERLKENNFEHSFQNIKYENAGHLISSNPEENSNFRTGTINIDGKNYEYEYGGTNEGDYKAKQDAKIKLIEFFEKM
ncbi:palmitoyl-CoA hydrolase [Flagellimonas sp. 389]|nr:palmitoyl-CoA hydrolase [Flagellimonas sp. 389]